MVKMLPIKMQKEINNLMYNAAYLCIILNYENMYPWFYERYTQLFFTEDKIGTETNEKETFMDFHGGWTEPRQLFDIKYMMIDQLDNKNCIDLIKRILNKDEYIYTYIDEYYVGEEAHNSHDVLVYGYDDDKEEVYLLGFKENYFSSYTLSYGAFKKSFESSLQIAKDSIVGRDYQLFTLTPLFDENTECRFDLFKFMSSFKQYLDSEYSYDNENSQDTLYEQGVFGIQIYEKILKALENSTVEKPGLDYRLIHTLYEHKKIMLERAEYIYKYEIKKELPGALLSDLQDIVELANKIRFQVLEFILTSNPAVLYPIASEVERLYAKETKAYNVLYNHIRSSLLARSL